LVRLLSDPLIGRGEIADLIRRDCLAFHPTERDWADFRSLGADAAVLGSVGSCSGKSKPLGAAGIGSLTVVPLPARLVVPAGTDAVVRVLVKRGTVVQPGVGLLLRSATQIPGAGTLPVRAVSDENGLAVFHLPVGHAAATYRLSVALASGAELPGAPVVELDVPSGLPVVAEVEPERLNLDSTQDSLLSIAVSVKDSLGLPVPGESVGLAGDSPALGVAPEVRTTDSLGHAAFVLERTALRRSGLVNVRVRGQRLASFELAVGEDAVAGASTGFVSGFAQSGVARTQLAEPLVFRAVSRSGKPLAGRLVWFRAHNADIVPDSATTDSNGVAELRVTLGTRAGTAIVTASVDSVSTPARFRVAPAGASDLVVERDGVRVDGGRTLVTQDTTFVLRISAEDVYGNVAPIGSVARALADMQRRFNAQSRLLRMLRVQADSSQATVTFRPVALGTATWTLAGATVAVEVVRATQRAH
jgi:hypothetical protein